MRRLPPLALLAALIGVTTAAAEPLAVTTRAIESFAPAGTPEGPLRFLGGLVVRSDDDRFGGLSGIDLVDNDHALMVSDTGWLVRAKLVVENGRLSGLAEAEIDPLLPGGDVSKTRGDVEDIALDPRDMSRGVIVRERQANAMLSFEMVDGRPAEFRPQRVGAENRILRSNSGLESVTYAPEASPLAGEILTIAETVPSGMQEIPAWIAGKGQLSIVPHDGFSISSARFLPDGDLLLLERRFTATSGLGVRLRRIAGGTVAVGARLDGEIIFEAGMASEIDNLEGLAVHEDASGQVILTLVSDNNYSILQRTLILQFALGND